MSIRYKITDREGIYFLSFSVVGWIDVFTRRDYCDILLDSIRHCQQHKGLVLHAWCIMPSHVHMVASTSNKEIKLEDILRDMKKFTSSTIINAIRDNPQESRKEWLLKYFASSGREGLNQFWQYDNHPVVIYSPKIIQGKLDYIHNNPVVMGAVDEPWHYRYSSARDYSGGKGLLEVDLLI
jgi:REP element-mobilizing transposase RayT